MINQNLFSATSTATDENVAKPCLEGIGIIEFDQNRTTLNALFGPENNQYTKMKTEEELIEAIEWLDADDKNSEDIDIREKFDANVELLLDFEDYKEDKINK